MEICSYFCLTAGVGGKAEDLVLLQLLYDVDVKEEQLWIIDSAASNHFIAQNSHLTDFTSILPVKIMTGNGIILGLGRGNVILKTSIGRYLLKDVIWAPELKGGCALLSVTQLMRQGKRVICEDQGCKVIDKASETCIITGTLINTAIYVDMENRNFEVSPKNSTTNITDTGITEIVLLHGMSDTQPIEVWHARLGHLNQEAIKKLQNMSTGLIIGNARTHTVNENCTGCLQGSQHVQVSHIPLRKASAKLDAVWTDVKGPLLAKAIYAFRYFVTFTDDFTRFTWVFPLINKSEVFAAFRLFEAMVERQSGLKIKVLHMDLGGEYVSNQMREYCRNKGYKMHFTQSYAPNMNSIPERVNRILIEHASAMLWSAKLPIGFWYCAIQMAVYTKNRSPTKALKTTPYEAWYGEKPNLGHLKVFGCRAAAHVPDELRVKAEWTSKSTDCIFIGYSDTENLFELWDVKKGQFIRKRDVIFFEEELGHELLKGSALEYGTQILPAITESLQITPIRGEPAPQNETPLDPLPVQQHVQRLPTQQPRTTDRQFVVWDPSELQTTTTTRRRFERAMQIYTELQESDIEKEWLNYEQCTDYEQRMDSEEQHSRRLLVPEAEKLIPKGYKLALRDGDWKSAMQKEYDALMKNGTWELQHLPKERKAFPSKWVFSIKSGAKLLDNMQLKDTYKARLVARGDLQNPGVDFKETFAPVVKFVTFRILMTYVAIQDLECEHWDIMSAFLHGSLDLDLYMQQPPGFEDGTERVCKLNKAIYGLCQAARLFYQRLDKELGEVGYKKYSADWALWKNIEGSFLGCHVDDVTAVGTQEQLKTVKAHLAKVFGIQDFGNMEAYLGIRIQRNRSTRQIFLSQADYARKVLQEMGMKDCYPVSTPMAEKKDTSWDTTTILLDEKDKKRYQAAIGSLLYLMHGTRPDLAYAVIRLSQYSSRPEQHHWEGVKRILRYIKGTINAGIVLGRTNSELQEDLVGYFDSAHADTADMRSTCGYVFLLAGSPISWTTKVQKTVALSTTEAEYMAGTEAAREAIYLRSLVKTIFGWDKKVHLIGDNKGSLDLAKNPVFHARTKHIQIRHRFITQVVEDGIAEVHRVRSKDMLADGLTKAIPKDAQRDHLMRMGMRLHGWSLLNEGVGIKRKWSCSRCKENFTEEGLKGHVLGGKCVQDEN